MEYVTNAPKGAALLTSRKPGWFRTFDLTGFDINSIYHCTLAKVFGSYGEGLRFLFGEHFDAVAVPEDHGFCQTDSANGLMLQSEWIEIIKDLQTGDIPGGSEEEMRGE